MQIRDFETKLDEIDEQIDKLNSEIKFYKAIAFIVAGISLGMFFMIWGIFYNYTKAQYSYFIDVGTVSGGVLSSLFSLAGLLMVYVAFLGQKQQILQQQKELLFNNEELRLTRKEISNQSIEMEEQNKTMEKQRFENLFFQMMSSYEKNKNAFYIIMDRNLFSNVVDSFLSLVDTNRDITEEKLKNAFQYSLESNPLFENLFVRQLNSIFGFLKESDISAKEIEFYKKIIKSNLSKFELHCLFLVVNYDSSIVPTDYVFIQDLAVLSDIDIKDILEIKIRRQ